MSIKLILLILFAIMTSVLFKKFIVGSPIKITCNPKKRLNKKKDKFMSSIPIYLNSDDGFIYPVIVTIISACENMNQNTKYSFYILISRLVTNEDMERIKDVENFYENCEVFIKRVPEKIEKECITGGITAANFRLFISELITDIDKLIYLDGDTLVLKDLTEMYNTNMDGYYYKGFLDSEVKDMQAIGENGNIFICSGVLVMNLKKIREDKIVDKYRKFIEKKKKKYILLDQVVLNSVCQEGIGRLSPEYGTYNFYGKRGITNFQNRFTKGLMKDTFEDIFNAIKNPAIIHLSHRPKPWDRFYYDSLWFRKRNTFSYKNIWWKYAEKSNECENIYNFYLTGPKKYISILDLFK